MFWDRRSSKPNSKSVVRSEDRLHRASTASTLTTGLTGRRSRTSVSDIERTAAIWLLMDPIDGETGCGKGKVHG